VDEPPSLLSSQPAAHAAIATTPTQPTRRPHFDRSILLNANLRYLTALANSAEGLAGFWP
jgi:hypothetical protein